MPTRQEIKAKADEIRTWFRETCDVSNPQHRAAIQRAAQMIFSRQTYAEQESETTKDLNGRGFNGRDADFGSRIAKWRGDMTERMAGGGRKMMAKYARQLAEIKLGIP